MTTTHGASRIPGRAAAIATVLTAGLHLLGPYAAAQPASGALPGLAGTLESNALLTVEDDRGERIKGKLVGLSSSEIIVRTAGPLGQNRHVPAERIVRIARVDSRKNGLLIGLAAGAVPGLFFGHQFNQLCKNESPDYCPRAFFIFGGMTAAAGAWVGWEIDDLIVRETPVYSRAAVSPIASARRRGVQLSVRF